MAHKSSFLLAVLFVVNPFMLLFFQNCSTTVAAKPTEKTPQTQSKAAVSYTYEKYQ